MQIITPKAETISHARTGKLVVKILAYKEKIKPRKPGLLKGKIFMPDNFNDEDPEINKLFYEGKIFP